MEEYKTVKEKDVIVDIGANIGSFSYYMYDQAKIIYAIEANKQNFEDLKGYVEKYQLEKIKPFHLAIAGVNGMRKLMDCGGCGGYSIVAEGNVVEDIEGKTLNTFLLENKIAHVDILKIDVEAAEEEIFNALDFADAAKKIDFIIGENHVRPIHASLEKQGYVYKDLGNQIFTAVRL